MNARFGKILLSILCGALLLIAGCTTTAPSGAAPTPTVSTQVSGVSPDLGGITALLQAINDRVTLIAANTQSQATGLVTGNIILFDTQGNTGNTITNGSSVVSLPGGTCDIGVYAGGISMFTTIEELKDYTSTVYSRNREACLDVRLCRRTVTLDPEYPYLYLTYKPYSSQYRFSQVSLSYRCSPG